MIDPSMGDVRDKPYMSSTLRITPISRAAPMISRVTSVTTKTQPERVRVRVMRLWRSCLEGLRRFIPSSPPYSPSPGRR